MQPQDGQGPTPAEAGRAVGDAGPVARAGASTGASTGASSAAVAAALQELATVGQRPLAEHPDAYARVHAGLQQALSDIDDA